MIQPNITLWLIKYDYGETEITDTIYNLRHTQLDTQLMYQLHQIVYAYRPHTEPPSREEMNDPLLDKSPLSMVELAKDVGITYGRNIHD